MSDLDSIIYELQCVSERKFKPRSAFTFFVKDAMQASAGEGRCKTMAEAGARWSALGAAQKHPYEQKASEEKAKAATIQKEYQVLWAKHLDKLVMHVDAKDNQMKKERNAYMVAKKAEKQEERALKAEGRAQKEASAKKKREDRIAAERRKAAAARRVTRPPAKGAQASIRNYAKDNAPGRRTTVESLSVGLDPEWEVRESRKSPGFYYYFNTLTGTSQSERPQSRPAKRKGAAKVVAGKSRRQ